MLENEFHFSILRCFNKSNQHIIKAISPLNLCFGQPKILEYLLENDGAKAIDIADGCALDKSTVAGLILRMENMNLIEKRENKEDARSKNIYLTDKGRKKSQEVKEIVKKVDDKAMKDFSEEEKTLFINMLNRIIDNLSDWFFGDKKMNRKVKGFRTTDGAGVSLVRVLGNQTVKEFDPILMLDSFDSTNQMITQRVFLFIHTEE